MPVVVPPIMRACIAEFIGTFIFQLLGGSASYAPTNGLILAVCIYFTAPVSGGVLNPAVATTLLAVGEMPMWKYLLYVVSELSGACIGALTAAAADPSAPPLSEWTTMTNTAPGCVPPSAAASASFLAIFLWEGVGTFTLCATVLATAVAKPGFGHVAPLAIGLTVAVNVGTSGGITGGCYNPARFFGPALIFGCRLQLIWLYWIAEAVGGLAAAYYYVSTFDAKARSAEATPIIGEVEMRPPSPASERASGSDASPRGRV